MSPVIGIVDYGMGNLVAVENAFSFLGAVTRVIDSPEEIKGLDAVVLPGVGAFGQAMENLRSTGFIGSLREAVVEKKLPYLGICLGMQILAKRSSEMGDHEGLGWLSSRVEKISGAKGIRIPHVSWNQLKISHSCRLLDQLTAKDSFYFDHSYQFAKGSEHVVASTNYEGSIPAVVAKDNIFATQFHPEKSQRSGLLIMSNFLKFVADQ